MARRRQWERMNRKTFLTAQMKDCLADIESARKKGSMTVLSSVRKLAIEIRTELDELAQVEAETPAEQDMSEDELVSILAETIRHLPIEQVEQIADVVRLRLGQVSLPRFRHWPARYRNRPHGCSVRTSRSRAIA